MVIRHDSGAFHLPAEFPLVAGLAEDVERLRAAGRPGAALEVVLRVLREDDRSAHAYQCALGLCAGRTARSDRDAVEPITLDQYRDPLLAPITTVCTNCGAGWFSAHAIFASEGSSITALNPIGLQCQQCRYTLCRTCLTEQPHCPQQSCDGSLGTPVLATGPPIALGAGRVEYVLVMWETTQPGAEDLAGICAQATGGRDITGAGITVLGTAILDEQVGLAAIYQLELDGQIGPHALERTRSVLLDTPGLGQQRVLLIEEQDGVGGSGSQRSDGRRQSARRWAWWPRRR